MAIHLNHVCMNFERRPENKVVMPVKTRKKERTKRRHRGKDAPVYVIDAAFLRTIT